MCQTGKRLLQSVETTLFTWDYQRFQFWPLAEIAWVIHYGKFCILFRQSKVNAESGIDRHSLQKQKAGTRSLCSTATLDTDAQTDKHRRM